MSKHIVILKTAEVKDGFIYLEEEPHLKELYGNEARFATHAGRSPTDRYWGHYCMTYEEAYEDYLARIQRGY